MPIRSEGDEDQKQYGQEIVYALCDGCREEFPVEELEECPSSWYEVKHGISVHNKFCRDCCEEIFQSEGCQSDVGNCDRASEIMSNRIKEYAEKKGYKKWERKGNAYLNQRRVFCISDVITPFHDFFNEEPIYQLSDDNVKLFEIFKGKDFLILKGLDKIVLFSKEDMEEIFEAFRELDNERPEFLRYAFLKSKNGLMIYGTALWAALAPMEGTGGYETEKANFLETVCKGYDFFEINRKDGLVLVDTKRIDYDWSKLDNSKFVELCRDIISSFPNFEEVTITEGTGDLGQDISAIEIFQDMIGQRKQKWTIQCKHFPSRKVSRSDIVNIMNSYSQLKFDVFCLMTSNLLSPTCFKMLKAWEKVPELHIRTSIWDRKKIEDYLKENPEIYVRYFH